MPGTVEPGKEHYMKLVFQIDVQLVCYGNRMTHTRSQGKDDGESNDNIKVEISSLGSRLWAILVARKAIRDNVRMCHYFLINSFKWCLGSFGSNPRAPAKMSGRPLPSPA